jgi:hypothetical protein
LEGGTVARVSYEVRVVGSLGPAARQAFADLTVDVEPTSTVLSGDLEQADLHALLDRVRALGLELVEVRQAPRHPLDSRPTGHPRSS